jgi:class 3 adenylate cyclase
MSDAVNLASRLESANKFSGIVDCLPRISF